MIRAHQLNELGWCTICGAAPWRKVQEWLRARGKPIPESDTRECRWRAAASLCPEPQRRDYACEDRATIARRLAELQAETTEALTRPPKP